MLIHVVSGGTSKNSMEKPESQNINIGVVEYIDSNVLNQKREIWKYECRRYYNMNEVGVQYPVTYVMDGESQFKSTAAIVDQLSSQARLMM